MAIAARPQNDEIDSDLDVVIVGAGFAGIYALYRALQLGLSVRVVEAGDGVGGTWHWNRYPGARVDVESMLYSYSFSHELQQKWHWRHRYAPQSELQEYADHVVERFDLLKHIHLNSRVIAASYRTDGNRWEVTLDNGARLWARYLISAVGPLSTVNYPDISGLQDFAGRIVHTSRWPHEMELRGKRVGVIGTGSTGIQLISAIAPEVEHLYVFQRTANFSLPITNSVMDETYEQEFKKEYARRLGAARAMSGGASAGGRSRRSAFDVSDEERQEIYERAWEQGGAAVLAAFSDIMFDSKANDTAAEFVRSKIRQIVNDPEVAEILCPKGYPIGTKRICMDTGYYKTFNRDNVRLVDLTRDPISRLTEAGLATAHSFFPLDVLIFATGFDAVTGAVLDLGVTEVAGRTLVESWKDGPKTFLGLATAGFPNFFMLGGPLSTGVLANGFFSIEQHVDFLIGLLTWAQERGFDRIEATDAAQNAWAERVDNIAQRTLYPKANSWYLGANIPGKPRVFMLYAGGFANFRADCDRVADADYEGFRFSRSREGRAAGVPPDVDV